MKFINSLKTLFKATKDDAVPVAVRDAFNAARSRFEQSQEAVKSDATRAKNCGIIIRARYRFDQTDDVEAYEKEIAGIEPADFVPYTEAELDAYTAKIENLTVDFDNFATAFVALDSATSNRDDEFYIDSAACFNIYCETYKIAVGNYKMATLLAKAVAASAKTQALKDSAKAWIRAIALNPDAEAEKNESEIKAELFQEKAKSAEIKAEAFLAKIKKILEE